MKTSKKYGELSCEELRHWIEGKKSFYLIDTLSGDHFRGRHLPGAKNACVFEISFIDQVKAITAEKDSEIVLYGASKKSLDAVTAAEKLGQEGFRHLNVLIGGIEAWHSLGLPLEGESIDAIPDPQKFLKLEDRSYLVDRDQSVIAWKGRNPSTTHFGNIRIASGKLSVKGGIITGIFDIVMDSITNTNLEGDELQPVLIAHLKSDDFFLTKLFPRARFEITEALPTPEPYLSLPNYLINGTLEIKGIKANQQFTATLSKTPQQGLMAEAHFDIDRTRWGVIYGSTRFFEYLGMHLVFDLITFEVRIVAN